MDDRRCLISTEVTGRNSVEDGPTEWILSNDMRLSESGERISREDSKYVLTADCVRLACRVSTSLDDGEAFFSLYRAIENFMPDNSVACLACSACFAMGTMYERVIQVYGQMGVPFLYGDYGSCKSLASSCALSLFGAEATHSYNNQTTPSYLFDVMKRTTIPVFVDDLDKKSHDLWEELVVDVYNNTPRGTRSYGVERFRTIPIVSANWRFSNSVGRAFTRCIVIPFSMHKDEPDATKLYLELAATKKNSSASVGCIIRIASSFESSESQSFYHDEVFPAISAIFKSSHARFKSTMTTFMWFFLKAWQNNCKV